MIMNIGMELSQTSDVCFVDAHKKKLQEMILELFIEFYTIIDIGIIEYMLILILYANPAVLVNTIVYVPSPTGVEVTVRYVDGVSSIEIFLTTDPYTIYD